MIEVGARGWEEDELVDCGAMLWDDPTLHRSHADKRRGGASAG